MSTPITRKTLAQKIGGDINAERLRKNHKTWGLDKCQVRTGTRAVLIDLDKAKRQLRKIGMDVG